MDQSSEKPKFNIRLLIDQKKNRVVLAEADRDFVEVLCGLLTLPMGTIVRLLEKHQSPESSAVGCFTNLYKSVSDMSVDNFETQACKDMLLYPRCLKESHCRRLKLNPDDTEPPKFFLCPLFMYNSSCGKVFSSICTTTCSCGKLMTREILFEEEEQTGDGVFLSCRSSFIITDDLKVLFNSVGNVMNVLNDLGYAGFDKLQEKLIEVGSDEVLMLLGYIFTSDTPLTDTFLVKDCVTRKDEILAPLVPESSVTGPSLTLKVFVRKLDRVILYAECREEFVDFLFTLLAIPLEFVVDLSINNANMGCVGNLCRSVKGLSFEEEGEATVSKCVLPHFYNCRAQLLDVIIQEMPEYECLVAHHFSPPTASKLYTRIKHDNLGLLESILKLSPMNLKSKGTSDSTGIGFVKGKTNFMVSDDLYVTAMNSFSTISVLSKLKVNINDIEEHVISIGKAEATSLLRASLITTSALTNGLSKFLPDKKLTKATQSTLKIPKSEEAQ